MADRDLTNTATISWDFATAAQAKANLVGASASTLTDLENLFGSAVEVTGTPSGSNDNVAIQAKMDALVAGGGTLVVRPGTYLVDNLVPKSNVNICGLGWKSILKQRVDAGWPINGSPGGPLVENVIVRDLQVDGNKGAGFTEGSGLGFLKTKNLTVEGCYIHDTAHGGILCGHPTPGVGGQIRILNNYIDNPGASVNAGWGGIGITGGNDLLVRGNIILTSAADGKSNFSIDVEPELGMTADGVIITDNICRAGAVIVQNSASGTVVGQVKIAHNIIFSSPIVGTRGAVYVVMTSGAYDIEDNYCAGQPTDNAAVTSFIDTPGGIGGSRIMGNFITGMGAAQDTYPDNVAVNAGSSANVSFNYIHAAAPTHATVIAGFKQQPAVAIGNIFHPNITVRGVFQSGDLVLTAALPAASATMTGKSIIEDAGAGVYHKIDYISDTVRLRDLVAF